MKNDEVEIKVGYCGICHSDLSMVNNEWGFSLYPLVPGHEVIGEVVRMGGAVRGLKVGQKIGLGWTAESCQHCDSCIGGHANMCLQTVETVQTVHGGFRLRTMIDFAARKQVEPVVEEFGMSDVNREMERLESGKARYRIVLKNDF